MSGKSGDACGCFPSGRHYPGIAHLLRASVRGVAEEFSAEAPWEELPIAMLDVETTGRDDQVDRVVELGIVVGRGDTIVRRHNWLIQPGIPMPAEAQAVHGISDDDLAGKPTFAELAAEIADALVGTIPAAYNASFDRGFLHAEFGRAKVSRARDVPALRPEVSWLDPLVWARAIQAGERSRSLGDVAARLGVKLTNAHRASDDAEAALKVLYALAREPGNAQTKGLPRAYGALVAEQRRIALAQADARRMWRNG